MMSIFKVTGNFCIRCANNNIIIIQKQQRSSKVIASIVALLKGVDNFVNMLLDGGKL